MIFFLFLFLMFPPKIPKHQTAFVKLEMHGLFYIIFILFYSPGGRFNLTSFLKPREKKHTRIISSVFKSIFKLRDVVLLPFYKVCSL